MSFWISKAILKLCVNCSKFCGLRNIYPNLDANLANLEWLAVFSHTSPLKSSFTWRAALINPMWNEKKLLVALTAVLSGVFLVFTLQYFPIKTLTFSVVYRLGKSGWWLKSRFLKYRVLVTLIGLCVLLTCSFR